jgi:hypothetical protein
MRHLSGDDSMSIAGDMRSMAAVAVILAGAGSSAFAVEAVYDIDEAEDLSQTTGKPILAIAGTTG